MVKVEREPIDENHFFPKRYTVNCVYCKEKVKQVCPAPPYSGLECSVCKKKGITCEWPAPKDVARNLKAADTALTLSRAGVIPEKIRRPGGKKTGSIDDDPYEEELDGGPLSKRKPSDSLGSNRNRVESRSGPSRSSGNYPETKLRRNDSDSFDSPDRLPKKPRPFGDRPRRTPSPRKRPRQTQDSSDLSDPSSPDVSRMDRRQDNGATPRAHSPSRRVSNKPSERNISTLSQRTKERDVSATSQRPSERNVSAVSQRPSERIASNASGSNQLVTSSQGMSKRRNVVNSSDDEEPSRQHGKPRRAENDEEHRPRERIMEERIDRPRARLHTSPNRPKPKQRRLEGEEEDKSRRREESDEEDGKGRRKDGGNDEDRAEVLKRRRATNEDVKIEIEAERPRKNRDGRDPLHIEGNEKRMAERKVSRDEPERIQKVKRSLEEVEIDSVEKARDADPERPKKKKHHVEEGSSSTATHGGKEPSGADFSEDETAKRKDMKSSAVAQRAVDPSSSKRRKGDTLGPASSSGGDATPVARKAARQFGTGSSGKNTPVARKPAKDMVMDLLTASMSGASSAYASALGMTGTTTKESPYKRPAPMLSKPVIAAPKGTLDLMGTIKTISDFQSAAKRRYSEKYALMPINNAKSTLTTAFMGRFRERRSRGVYQNALSTLLPIAKNTRPEDQAAGEKSQIGTWLASHGTPSRVPPRLSASLSETEVAGESVDSAALDLKDTPQQPLTEAIAPVPTRADSIAT